MSSKHDLHENDPRFRAVLSIEAIVNADSLEGAMRALSVYPDHIDNFTIKREVQVWTEATAASGLPPVWKTVNPSPEVTDDTVQPNRA